MATVDKFHFRGDDFKYFIYLGRFAIFVPLFAKTTSYTDRSQLLFSGYRYRIGKGTNFVRNIYFTVLVKFKEQ